MYTVYILQSRKNKRRYFGHCANLTTRLQEHNGGKVKSTKFGIPWTDIYTEVYRSRSEAYTREKEIKRYKGGIQLQKLLLR